MKIIRKTISALLLAGVGITSIQAQNNSSQAWTLRQCIDYAIEHNIKLGLHLILAQWQSFTS